MAQGITKISHYSNKKESESVGAFGFCDVTKIVGDIYSFQLIIVGSRPAMGRTQLLLQTMFCNILKGKKVLFASFEQNTQLVMHRFLELSRAMLNASKQIDYSQWMVLVEENLLIYDPQSYCFEDFRSMLTLILEEGLVDMVFIDGFEYLQYDPKLEHIKPRYNSACFESFVPIKPFRHLVNYYGTPFMLSAQCERYSEWRCGDKFPEVSDLKANSDIDDMADTILLLHRPDYYGITEDEFANKLTNVTQVKCAKNRFGSTGLINLNYNVKLKMLVNKNDG